ncbi:MAG: YqgE/AlgH family protein [Planctomycetes bacterium]|nr:YqgE/AlgH family protein [Planctomycetota bacterium]
MDSLKGSFLVASPGLVDPNFARTVVFIVEHNAEGAFGLVLSRPLNLTLWNLCGKIFEDPGELSSKEILEKYTVYTGGPVQPSAVFFLHNLVETGKEAIKPGVILGSQPEDLRLILARLGKANAPLLRIFFGYAGWAPKQLEKELKAGGWLVKPATLEQVFHQSPESLWNQMVQSFGGALGIFGMMPPHPELN